MHCAVYWLLIRCAVYVFACLSNDDELILIINVCLDRHCLERFAVPKQKLKDKLPSKERKSKQHKTSSPQQIYRYRTSCKWRCFIHYCCPLIYFISDCVNGRIYPENSNNSRQCVKVSKMRFEKRCWNGVGWITGPFPFPIQFSKRVNFFKMISFIDDPMNKL